MSGPRQVGKTTAVLQALDAADAPTRYAGADEPTLRDADRLAEQWTPVRMEADAADGRCASSCSALRRF